MESKEKMASESEVTSYKYTLVHGTFSADADWVNQHETDAPSDFRGRLTSAHSKNIEFSVAPAWGQSTKFGKLYDLTNKARLKGAEDLKQHILSQPQKDNQKHFIIAHSHGGNVALYALQDERVNQQIDGVICLATPFLFPRKRPLSLVTLGLSLVIMLIGVMQFIWTMNLLERSWVEWLGAMSLIIIGIVVPSFLVWVVFKERFLHKAKKDRVLEEHIEKLSYKDTNTPILLIRSSGDEASGLLRSSQFLNWFAGMVMRLGKKPLYLRFCAISITLLWMAYNRAAWLPDSTFSIVSGAIMASSALMICMLMALTISRLSVGFDAWRWVGELETMIEDGPPGITSELMVITPRQPKSGLSHTSVYDETETIDAIKRWCSKETANAKADDSLG